MRQTDYEVIIQCIQFGAPALATGLVTALNQTIEDSNSWVNEQKRLANEAHRAEMKAAAVREAKEAKEAKEPKSKDIKE